MNAVSIVVVLELIQLSRQIKGVPEEPVIEMFAANGADEPLDEGMGNWGIRDRLDFLDLEDSKVGEPAVEAKQRVVIGAQVLWSRLARDGAIEHPTDRPYAEIRKYSIKWCTA